MFLQSVACSITLLIMHLGKQKFINLMKSNSSKFSFMVNVFVSCLRNLCLLQSHEDILLHYFLELHCLMLQMYNLPRIDFCMQCEVGIKIYFFFHVDNLSIQKCLVKTPFLIVILFHKTKYAQIYELISYYPFLYQYYAILITGIHSGYPVVQLVQIFFLQNCFG